MIDEIADQCRTLVTDSQTGDALPFHNVGIATDVRLARIDGSVYARKDHIVVRIPHIPLWLWGHRLIYPNPPGVGDFERWEENYCQVFEGHQEPTQRSFSWDGVDGEPGVEQPFLDAGYRSLNHVILKGNEFNRPTQANQSITVRPLATNAEWADMVDCAYDANVKKRDLPGYRADIMRMFTRYRRLCEANHSLWFGAFDGDRLVGTLGIFGWGTLGRYQGVIVREEYRGQGVGRQLVFESTQQAQSELGIRDFIIGTGNDSSPQRLYEDVGFQVIQRERGLVRRAPRPEEAEA